ncbi:MAG: hypothetical protein JNK15_02225 [Planctomycetes bacterium]|nr:hypothetical protein [Planctomycetota bacterium]
MRPFAIAAALLAAACGSVSRSDDWVRTLPEAPGGFRATGHVDAMDPAAIWGIGDRVEYTIEVVLGTERRTFTFTLTTTALPESRTKGIATPHPVHDRILTRTAHESWQHGPVVAYHAFGPAKVRAELRSADGTECSGEFEVESLANLYVEDVRTAWSIGVHGMFGALLGLDCMHATLLRLVRRPSAWSVLARLGRVEVQLQWPELDRMEIVEASTPFGTVPTAWRPMTILANGQPALDGRVQFTWKQSPLLLAAGVLQVEAWHPDDPTARITIRLASARRGIPPDSPDPDELGGGLRRGMTVADACSLLGGTIEKELARGCLADGRRVELLQLRVPRWWLVVVVHEGRLVFASGGDDLSQHWLKVRGFVPDAADDAAR